MIIKSYLAYPASGKCSELAQELTKLSGCDVVPATNQELLVLVTESADKESERKLTERLKDIPNLQSLTLVSGHNDQTVSGR